MPRPDRFPDPHPVPRQRRVVITAMDKRFSSQSLEALLLARGLDLAQPYHEEPGEDDATVYVQDIPEDAA